LPDTGCILSKDLFQKNVMNMAALLSRNWGVLRSNTNPKTGFQLGIAPFYKYRTSILN